MKKLTLAIVLLSPLACFAGDDFTPLDVKPGLWETTMKSQASSPLSGDAAGRLSPAQRPQADAATNGPKRGPQTRVTKSCLTTDDIKKPFALNDDAHAVCQRTIVSSSANKQEVHFECAKGPVKSTGEIKVEATSAESFQGTSRAASGDGSHTMTFRVSFTGRWLGADCGPFTKKQ